MKAGKGKGFPPMEKLKYFIVTCTWPPRKEEGGDMVPLLFAKLHLRILQNNGRETNEGIFNKFQFNQFHICQAISPEKVPKPRFSDYFRGYRKRPVA